MATPLPIRLRFPTAIPAEGTIVEIDGQDVTTSLRALTFRAEVGHLTTLTLELGLLGEVDIDGVVQVEAVADDPDAARARVVPFSDGDEEVA